MNTLIYGQIGSGKTYYTVENVILPALKSGRFVYTNIDFGHKYLFDVWSKFSNYLNQDISKFINVVPDTKEFLELLKLIAYDVQGCRLPLGSVVVIDEAHQVFNYLQTNYISKQVYEFLAYSRHFNIDLIFITQSPELLSKFVLNLCNNFISVYNLKQNSSVFKSKFVVEIKSSYAGLVLEKRIKTFRPEVFALYKSFLGTTDESLFKRSLLPKGFMVPAVGVGLSVLFLVIGLIRGFGYLHF